MRCLGLGFVPMTMGSIYLLRQTVQLQCQVHRRRLAVVDGVTPGTATPLPSGWRPVQLLYRHVAVGAAIWREGHELADGKCVKGQLQTQQKIGHLSHKVVVGVRTWVRQFLITAFLQQLEALSIWPINTEIKFSPQLSCRHSTKFTASSPVIP